MAIIRYSVVSGMFYPDNPQKLREMIKNFLEQSQSYEKLPIPKAIIAPHAGYEYSGLIAANAYACLKNAKKKISTVVLLAPAHYYPFQGLATTSAQFYETPLGQIKINQQVLKELMQTCKYVSVCEEAFTYEHSVEVQLPFLQTILENNFSLVPLLVGQSSTEEIAKVLETLWGKDDTLIVISSDLSHYKDYSTALELDKSTIAAILNYEIKTIESDHACGHAPIKGLLAVAQKKRLKPALVSTTNSGSVTGIKNKVVGYCAIHFRG